MEKKIEKIRCFFALWPDDSVRSELAELSLNTARKPARLVNPANLHITLAFLGDIVKDRLPCFEQAAAKVAFSPFVLKIDEVGYFARPRVFWAGASDIPENLAMLHKALNTALTECNYRPETRPFVPHVTLARKSLFQESHTLNPAIQWQVDQFCLVKSTIDKEGVTYNVIGRWKASS